MPKFHELAQLLRWNVVGSFLASWLLRQLLSCVNSRLRQVFYLWFKTIWVSSDAARHAFEAVNLHDSEAFPCGSGFRVYDSPDLNHPSVGSGLILLFYSEKCVNFVCIFIYTETFNVLASVDIFLNHVMRKPVCAICEQQRCRSACYYAPPPPVGLGDILFLPWPSVCHKENLCHKIVSAL